MRAAQIREYGGPEVIRLSEVDKPTLKDGQLLIEVHAAAINPFDYKVRSGAYKDFMSMSLPYTIGGDFSGMVAEVGKDVTGFEVGQAVYGAAQVSGGASGSMAEFAAAKASQVAAKPKSIDDEHAAAAALVGVSALQALDEHLKLKAGQKILIHGGAGGIGHSAIQYAKKLGAYVATTVKAGNSEFVKSLGADEVIDYENQKFEEVAKDYDAVFDTVGGDTYSRSFGVLKKGGTIVSMSEQPNEELAQRYEVKALHQSSKTNTETLQKLAGLIDEGTISINVDKVFPLYQVVEAFKYQETGHPKGKVVVSI